MNFKRLKLISIMALSLCFAVPGNAQQAANVGFQKHNFQYLSAVLTRTTPTSNVIANAWNSVFPPKFYSMSVTGTLSSAFTVELQGSLDNLNWSNIAVTNSVIGVISNLNPKPMLFFRLLARTLSANTSITATAIGVP